MKEKRNYEIIKKWTEGKINIHRVKMLLNYSERHLYRLKKIYKKKAKKDLNMVIKAGNQK